MNFNFINPDDPIWAEIVTKLPKDNNGKEEEKLQLLNVTLYLLYKKQKYSLQLKWESLKDDDFKNTCLSHGNSYYADINVDSLRKKFDRWRNNGTWEKILPIFFQYGKYRWVIADGRYEVFFVCSKFIRDKNKNHKHSLKLQNIVHQQELADLKIKHDAKVAELNNDIANRDNEIWRLKQSNYKKHEKNYKEQEKFNQEMRNLLNERNKAILKANEIEKMNRFYVRKLHQYGYSPVGKNLDIKYLNNFNEVLKSSKRDDDDWDEE